MNKPVPPPVADDAIGPLDAQGQQVWSAEQIAAVERIEAEPAFQAALEKARREGASGNVLSHDAHLAVMAERKRRWSAERGR